MPMWPMPIFRILIHLLGQPRDGDPRAAYAVLNLDKKVWEFRRVAYSISITQERMRARGLPLRLIERLEVGR